MDNLLPPPDFPEFAGWQVEITRRDSVTRGTPDPEKLILVYRDEPTGTEVGGNR